MELMGRELTGTRSGHRSKRPPGIREASVATPTGTQAVDRAARLVTEVVRASDWVTFTELAARPPGWPRARRRACWTRWSVAG